MIIQIVESTGITNFDAATAKHSQQVKLQQKITKHYILRCITSESEQCYGNRP